MTTSIRVYALSTCRHCQGLRKFLSERGVEFHCTEVDKLPKDEVAEVLEELRTLSERYSFPTIVIGSQVITGFRLDKIREALNL